MSENHLFTLPNGSHLSYCYPMDLSLYKSQFEFKNTYKFFDKFKITSKTNQVTLGCLTSRSDQILLVADFDELPIDFLTSDDNTDVTTGKHIRKDDWKRFLTFMEMKYPDGKFVHTRSGKVKGFFLVDTKYKNKYNMLLSYLFDILDLDDYELIDKSYSAITTTYINKEMADKLSKWLPNAVVIEANEYVTTHKFSVFTGTIPVELNTFISSGRTEKSKKDKENFIRLILNRYLLTQGGFELPVTKLSRELNITIERVHSYLKELKKLKFIKLLSKKYFVGRKSKKYKAANRLLGIMRAIFNIGKKAHKHIKLPSYIESGHWHRTIWEFSKYYTHAVDEFIDHFEKLALDTNKYKSRRKKAINAINYRLRITK